MPEISAVNPGVDPWVPAAETLITLPTQFILPDAPRRGHRRQLWRPAPVPLSQGRLGRDLRHRRRPGRVRAQVRPDQDRPEDRASDLVSDRVDPARQALGRQGGAARAGQPAGRLRHVSGLADLPDPRHQQALRRRPPGQPRLHPDVSGRRGAALSADPGRHHGDRRRAVGRSSVGTRASSISRPSPISCRSTSSKRIRASRRPPMHRRGSPADHRPGWSRGGSDRLAVAEAELVQRAAFRCRSPGRSRRTAALSRRSRRRPGRRGGAILADSRGEGGSTEIRFARRRRLDLSTAFPAISPGT